MRKMRSLLILGLLTTLLMTACSSRALLIGAGVGAAAAGTAAAVYYVKGDLEGDLEDELGRVHKASIAEVRDRGYTIESEDLTALEGNIEARIPAGVGSDTEKDKDKALTIKTKRTDQNTTHISIRVGVFGDEPLSRDIHGDIMSRLGR